MENGRSGRRGGRKSCEGSLDLGEGKFTPPPVVSRLHPLPAGFRGWLAPGSCAPSQVERSPRALAPDVESPAPQWPSSRPSFPAWRQGFQTSPIGLLGRGTASSFFPFASQALTTRPPPHHTHTPWPSCLAWGKTLTPGLRVDPEEPPFFDRDDVWVHLHPVLPSGEEYRGSSKGKLRQLRAENATWASLSPTPVSHPWPQPPAPLLVYSLILPQQPR